MSTSQRFEVEGMTCGSCVRALTKELRTLADVTDVAIDLVPGGTSNVRITSTEALNPSEVASAIDAAGYVQVVSPSLARGVPRELELATVGSSAVVTGSAERTGGCCCSGS